MLRIENTNTDLNTYFLSPWKQVKIVKIVTFLITKNYDIVKMIKLTALNDLIVHRYKYIGKPFEEPIGIWNESRRKIMMSTSLC